MSELELARESFARGEVATAVRIWRKLAEEGDSTAQLRLGQLYRYGDGVEVDDEEAVKWYILASQQGSDVAFHKLRLMHIENRATLADLRRALSSQATTAQKISSQAVPGEELASQSKPVEEPSHQENPVEELASPPNPPGDSQAEDQVVARTQENPAVDWLRKLSAEQYLLQIRASPKRQEVEQYARKYLEAVSPPPQVVPTTVKGRDWYVLLLGPFDARKGASEMLDRLPSEVQKGKPWIRTVSSVRQVVNVAD